jgi:hypothetical protein
MESGNGYGFNLPNDFPNLDSCECSDLLAWWGMMRPLLLEMSSAVDANQINIGDLVAGNIGGGGGGGTHTTYQGTLAGPAGYAGMGAPTLPPTSFIAISFPAVICGAGERWSFKAYASIFEDTGVGGTAWLRIVNVTDNVATPLHYGFTPGPNDHAALSVQMDGTQQVGDVLFPTSGTKNIVLELGGTFAAAFTAVEMALSGSIITP